MIDTSKIQIGADPEFFLIHRKEGYYVPSIGLIGGTKEKPELLTDKGHAMQEDNVMVEFNIPPCSTSMDFINNIVFTMDKIKERLPEDLGIVIKPSAEFDEIDLLEPQAALSGCDPDYNAWLEEENDAPNLGVTTFRFAGGHIHLSYPDPKASTSLEIVKAMDMYLGVPSIILDRDNKRRENYGKAGCHRIKDYGVEYRTLSNFWLQDEALMAWVFNNAMRGINFILDGGNPNVFRDKIIKIINNSDVNKAKEFCSDNHIIYPTNEQQTV